MRPSMRYDPRYDSCSICSCEGFEAGYVDARLKDSYWPDPGKPDFGRLREELKQRFDVEATEQEIEEHWERHVRITLGEYRESARRNAEHGMADAIYDPEMLDDE